MHVYILYYCTIRYKSTLYSLKWQGTKCISEETQHFYHCFNVSIEDDINMYIMEIWILLVKYPILSLIRLNVCILYYFENLDFAKSIRQCKCITSCIYNLCFYVCCFRIFTSNTTNEKRKVSFWSVLSVGASVVCFVNVNIKTEQILEKISNVSTFLHLRARQSCFIVTKLPSIIARILKKDKKNEKLFFVEKKIVKNPKSIRMKTLNNNKSTTNPNWL